MHALHKKVSASNVDATTVAHQQQAAYEHETHQWAVELGSGVEASDAARKIASELGLRYVGTHSALDDVHLFEGRAPLTAAFRQRGGVIAKRSTFHQGDRWASLVGEKLRQLSPAGYAEKQVAKRRVKRAPLTQTVPTRKVPGEYRLNDPLYPQSWYLNGEAASGFDMNIKAAWQEGYTGMGIVVTILDDGIERSHPDLKANYDALASYDFNGRDSDPTPRYDSKNTNQHGTRCAGQVAAIANNSICSVGVAFNSRIGGVRMLDGKVTDALEADALSLRLDHIDVFSASWGPPDDGETVDGPSHLARRALLRGILKGRDGRGSIYVWSSGNGGLFEDSCACDGYANSIYTLSISSASERGMKPWYLEECASTIAATYSSGEPMFERQIVTTDIRGGCTDNHTGTSASAPIAAGLVALTLEANPRLTWRDVQHIVVETARPEPLLEDGEFMTNGVGKKVSSRFGFGLMDGLAMVKLAEQWKTVPEQHICTAAVNDLMPHPIPPDEPLVIAVVVDACAGTEDYVRYLEHVEVRISLWYTARGDLEIYLTSPSGTRTQLLPPRAYDDQKGEFRDWPFISVQFWGENGAGNWTLEISNVGQDDNAGDLRRWSLILHGTEMSPAASTLHRRSAAVTTNNVTSLATSPTLTSATTDEPLANETCPSNCLNCSSSTTCSNCRPGFYLTFQSSQCLSACTPGTCADSNKMLCGLCLVDDNASLQIFEDSAELIDIVVAGTGRSLPGFIESAALVSRSPQCEQCSTLWMTLAIAVTYVSSMPETSDLMCAVFCALR